MDIDGAILSVINQLDFEWIDCGELIDYIKDNYTITKTKVIQDYANDMGWKVDIKYLDSDKILKEKRFNKYTHLGNNLYIDIDRLTNDKLSLQRKNLII